MTLHTLDAPDPALPSGPVPPLATDAWALTRPDRHLALTDGGALVARASLWWTRTPALPGDPEARVGLVGHYAAADDTAAAALLDRVLGALRAEGATYALGPMDGSTWHAYRLVTDAAPSGAAEPPFFLEPFTPPVAVGQFERAGFTPVARYFSARVPRLEPAAERREAAERRVAEAGITIRPFAPADAEAELRRLYAVAVASFVRNPFYTPQPEAVFAATYRPLLQRIHPDLLLLAERDGAPAGFVFAVPDLAQAARSEPVDTAIVKTVAVHPEAQGAGLGGALVLRVQEAARRRGFTRALHALMHEANVSARISRHDAYPMRRYALFGRPL